MLQIMIERWENNSYVLQWQTDDKQAGEFEAFVQSFGKRIVYVPAGKRSARSFLVLNASEFQQLKDIRPEANDRVVDVAVDRGLPLYFGEKFQTSFLSSFGSFGKVLSGEKLNKRSAGDRLDKLIQQRAAADGISYSAAFELVRLENQKLYEAYVGKGMSAGELAGFPWAPV